MKLYSYKLYDNNGAETWYCYRGKFHNARGWAWKLVVNTPPLVVEQEFYYLNGELFDYEEWQYNRYDYL